MPGFADSAPQSPAQDSGCATATVTITVTVTVCLFLSPFAPLLVENHKQEVTNASLSLSMKTTGSPCEVYFNHFATFFNQYYKVISR